MVGGSHDKRDPHLQTMVIALEVAHHSLERPNNRGWVGDWQITGKRGHILSDGKNFYIYHFAESSKAWTYAKRALSFAVVTQDGDNEGIFRMDRLPSPYEARTIREYLRINMTKPPPVNAFRARQDDEIQSGKVINLKPGVGVASRSKGVDVSSDSTLIKGPPPDA